MDKKNELKNDIFENLEIARKETSKLESNEK